MEIVEFFFFIFHFTTITTTTKYTSLELNWWKIKNRWHSWTVLRFAASIRIWRISTNVKLPVLGRLCWSWKAIAGNNMLTVGIQNQISGELLLTAGEPRVRQHQQNLWVSEPFDFNVVYNTQTFVRKKHESQTYIYDTIYEYTVWVAESHVSMNRMIKTHFLQSCIYNNCVKISCSPRHSFYDECKRRYTIKLWKTFTDCFNCLPVAAIGMFARLNTVICEIITTNGLLIN